MNRTAAVVLSLLLAAGLVVWWLASAKGPTADPVAPIELATTPDATPKTAQRPIPKDGNNMVQPEFESPKNAASPYSFTPESALERLLQEGDAAAPVGAELDAIEAAVAQGLAAEPKNGRWHYGMGVVAHTRANASTDDATRRTHAEACFKHITEATKLDTKNADYFADLGHATMGTMKPGDGFLTMASIAGDARKAWEKAVELNPDHIQAHYSLATYQIQARRQGGVLFGSYSAAKKSGEKLVSLPKGKHLGHIVLGTVAVYEEKWDEVAKQFHLAEQTATTDSQRTSAMYTHARHMFNAKKDAKATLLVLERLAAQQPNFPMHLLRAQAKKLDGDYSGAIEDFKHVLAETPESSNARFLLAQCYESAGNPVSAIAMYEEFKTKFPDDDRVTQAAQAIKRLKAK